MSNPENRHDDANDLGNRVAAGFCLLCAALCAALVLAVRHVPREEVGAALAHGPATGVRPGVSLSTLWDAPGRDQTAAAVSDVNRDGEDELLVLDRDDTVNVFDARGHRRGPILLAHDAECLGVLPRRPAPLLVLGSMYSAVTVCDLSGNLLWSYSLSMAHQLTACVVADLDGDGAQEIIAAQSDTGISCLDARGRFKWELPLPGLIASLAVGDVNDDGRQELLVAGRDTPVFVVSDAGHLLQKWDIWASACYVATADLDGNGSTEVAVKTESFERPDKAFVAGVDASGQLTWRCPVPAHVRDVDRPLTAADIDGDGRREWAAVSGDGAIYFIGRNGELLGIQTVGEPAIGVYALRTKAAVGERLAVVSPTSALCLEPKGGSGG